MEKADFERVNTINDCLVYYFELIKEGNTI